MFTKSKGFTQFKKAMLIVALVAFLFEPLALAMPTEAWAAEGRRGEYDVDDADEVVVKAYAKPGTKAAAFGYESSATGRYSLALAYKSSATGQYSSALGYKSNAQSIGATAIGALADATGENSIAMGALSNATGIGSIATGYTTTSTGDFSIASGYHANASGTGAIAMGYNAQAIANNSSVTASGAIAIGLDARALDSNSIATGTFAKAIGANAVAIGRDATAELQSISIGFNANTTGNNAVAIGIGAEACVSGVATGDYAQATAAYSIATGSCASASNNSSIAIGRLAGADGESSIATGSAAQAQGSYSIATGRAAQARGNYSMATGYYANAAGNSSIATGKDAQARGNYSIATGELAQATADNAIATGTYSYASGMGSAAFGYSSFATAQYALAVGYEAGAMGAYSTAIGTTATASGKGSIALGSVSEATGDYSSALGYQAQAAHSNSVAIGSNSATGGENEVSVGNSLYKRKITNVAPGEVSATSTDAINGSQLYATHKNIIDISGDIANIQTNITGINANLSMVNVALYDLDTNKADKTDALKKIEVNNTGILSQTTVSGNTTNVAQLIDSRVSNLSLTNVGGDTYLNVGVMNNYTGISYDTQQLNVTELVNTHVDIKGSMGNISTSNGIVSTKTERIDSATGLKMVDVDMKIGEDFTLTNPLTKNYTNYTTGGIVVSNAANTMQSAIGYGQLAFQSGSNTATFGTGGLTINGKTYVSDSGLNANYQKIINVAPGTISKTSTDAVNGSQLYATNAQVSINTVNIQQNTERINNTYTKSETRSIASFGNTIGVTYNDNTYNKITLTGEGGTTITNIKEGDISINSTDAINGSQLYQTNMQLALTNKEVQEVGAMSAALAGLHYIEPSGEGDDRLVGAVAYGGYRGQNATAIGLGYKPHQNMMFTASTSIGTSQQSYNAGMSFKFGKGKTLNKIELQKQIKFINEENKKLKQIVVTQNKRIEQQGEQIQQLLQIVGEMRGKPVELKANGSADANVPVALLPPKQGEFEVEFGKDYDKAVIEAKVDGARKGGVATAYCREEKDDEGKTVYLARVPAANSDEAGQIGKKLKELGYEPETVRVQ